MLGQGEEFAVEPLHGGKKARTGDGAVEEIVGGGSFVLQRQLAADAPDRFGTRESVAAVQPSDLGGAICGDDDDLVHACVDTGLEEERHVVHDDCLRILAAGRLSQSGLLPRDARMNDLFQAAQLCRPSEDEGP